MLTFDLIEEPWIPVVRADGTAAELGLRETLACAHEIDAVRDPLPTVEFGLHRLLVAVVLDVFRPQGMDALGGLIQAGRFNSAELDAYFAQWRDRFDLFSTSHPFLQTPGMKAEAAKPLAGLLHPMPSGTNAAHFHHGREDDFGVSSPVAARLLTTIAPFMTAGGAGLSPSINGAPPWYALILGETLFQTLCLNAFALELGKYPLGLPAWRDDKPLTVGRCARADYLEALTWRPRRIQLIFGAGGVCALTGRESSVLVRTMKFAPGVSCEFVWRDPSVPYKADDKGPKVMRPQEGREVWRDTAPLALLHERDYQGSDSPIQFMRPALLSQFAQLAKEDYKSKGDALRLCLYGLRTDMKMKIFEWRREELSLPRDLVLQDKFHMAVQDATTQAGDVARALRHAVKATYDREGAGNKAAFDTLIAHSERGFWNALRPCFNTLLDGLASLAPTLKAEAEAVLDRWRQVLKETGRCILEDAVGDLDTDAGALKRQVLARQAFEKNLAYVLATPDQKAAWKAKKVSKAKDNKTKSAPMAAQGELAL